MTASKRPVSTNRIMRSIGPPATPRCSLLAWEDEPVEVLGSQPGGLLPQILPRRRRLGDEVCAVVEELHVQVAGDTVEEAVYAFQLQGPLREALELRPFQVVVERGEPLSLAWGVFGVGRDQVVGSTPRA